MKKVRTPLSAMMRTTVRLLRVISNHFTSTSLRLHSSPDIVITPRTSMIDQKVHICLRGLESNQIIRLVANVKENNVTFQSTGVFMANSNGEIDLDKDSSFAGTYTGKDPMGLFWSLEPCPGQSQGIRLVKKDVTSPLVVNLQVIRETDIDEVATTSDIITETKLERLYMKPSVKRIPVKEGKFRGTIFVPEGSGPFPGLTDMFGGLVSLVETRAALLASHGYATYAISYLYSEGLPQNLMGASEEYIRAATEWFFSQPYIDRSRLGAVGLCFGGSLSLLLAAFIPKIKAVVNVNGIPIIPAKTLKVHTKCSSGFTWPKPERVYRTSEGTVVEDIFECDNPVLIPAWQHGAKVLTIVGEDDKQVHPKWHFFSLDNWPNEFKNNLEVHAYPGAGHLIEPPYAPYTRAVKVSKAKMETIDFLTEKFHDLPFMTGGFPKQHAFAQEDSWRKILEFLKRELGT